MGRGSQNPDYEIEPWDTPSRPCSVSGCSGSAHVAGLCDAHFNEREDVWNVAKKEFRERLTPGEFWAHIKRVNESVRWWRWWESEPPPPKNRAPVPMWARRELAVRYGCEPGGTHAVTCPRCGASGEIRWEPQRIRFAGLHIDHVHPVSRGGKDDPDNLQLLCPACNQRKAARVGA